MNTPAPLAQGERLKIFIASPADVNVERKIVLNFLATIKLVIDDFDIYGWEETIPGFGSPAQQQINKQVPADQCHIVVGLFWHRFGTPPGLNRKDGRPYNSGTEYELDRAVQAYDRNDNDLPKIMIYHKIDDPCDKIKDNREEIIQYGRLLDFLRSFEPQRSWIYPVEGEKFEETIKGHLGKVLRELRENRGMPAHTALPSAGANGLKRADPTAVATWIRLAELNSITLDPKTVPNSTVSNRDLRDRIRFWLTSLSSNKRAPYSSVGQLCEPANSLANRIDDQIVELAQGSPRNAQWLIEHLFAFHCAGQEPAQQIGSESWQRVRYEWELLNRPRPAAASQADFRIQGKMIYFGASQLMLAVREQNLLRRLLEARGELCTIADLKEAGWPDEHPDGVQLKAVQEAIRRLRAKLKQKYQIDAKLWIETLYDQGYRMRLADEVRNLVPAPQKGGNHVH